MDDSMVKLRCPGCARPVFDGWRVVRCTKCEVHHHEPCWQERGGCAGTRGCKGKPAPVVLVHVPHQGPTADAVAAAVEARIWPELCARMDQFDAALPPREAVEEIRNEVVTLRDNVARRLSDLRKDMESRFAEQRAELSAELARLEERREPPLDRAALQATAGGLRNRMEELSKRTSEQVRELVENAQAQLASEMRATLEAVEACRWAVAAERNPFPWDEPLAGSAQGTAREEAD